MPISPEDLIAFHTFQATVALREDVVQDEHALEVVRLPDGKLGHKVLGTIAQVKDECKVLKIGRCAQ